MLEVTSNAARLSKELAEAGGPLSRRAVVYALNDAAADVLKHVQAGMRSRFDRPTRWTLNALHVWGAKVSDPTPIAEVRERPSVGSKHYLKVQETGGVRQQTGLERMLKGSLRYAGTFEALVTTRAAKLDASGNWSKGQRNQALSSIRAWGQSGYTANASSASKKRARGKRSEFFVPSTESRLAPGIYERDGKREVRKVASLTASAPRYKPLLGFFSGAEEVFTDRFDAHFNRIFDRLIRKEASK